MLGEAPNDRRRACLKEHLLSRKIIGKPAEYLFVLFFREIWEKTFGDKQNTRLGMRLDLRNPAILVEDRSR